MTVRVGLTLPSFVEDPEIPIAVARRRGGRRPRRGVRVRPLLAGRPAQPAAGARVLRAARCSRGRDDADPGRHARRARDVATGGHARELVPHRAARQRRPADRRDRLGRFGEPRRERGVRAAVRHDGRSRRRAARRGARRRATATFPCGSAVMPRRCARSCRWPTAGTGGAATPSASAADVALVRELAPDATMTWGGLTLTGTDDAAALAKAEDAIARRRRARRRAGASRRAAPPVRRPGRRVGHPRSGRLVEPRQRRTARRGARPVAAVAVLLVINGAPGVGKSTLAPSLRRRPPAHARGRRRPSPDAARRLAAGRRVEGRRARPRGRARARASRAPGTTWSCRSTSAGPSSSTASARSPTNRGVAFAEVVLTDDRARIAARFRARRAEHVARGELHPEYDVADDAIDRVVADAARRVGA